MHLETAYVLQSGCVGRTSQELGQVRDVTDIVLNLRARGSGSFVGTQRETWAQQLRQLSGGRAELKTDFGTTLKLTRRLGRGARHG